MITNLNGAIQAIWTPIHGMADTFLGYVPNLVLAMGVLFFGGMFARVVAHLLTQVLHRIKFDDLFKGLDLGKMLSTGGIKTGLTATIGTIIHWVLMLGVLASSLKILGVGVAGTLLMSVLHYLPGVLGAMFVMVIGIVIAKFLTSVITLVSKNVSFDEYPMVNTIVKYAVVVFSVVLALGQLTISAPVIHEMLMLLFGATCLGIAIAYGIRKGVGTKDVDLSNMFNV